MLIQRQMNCIISSPLDLLSSSNTHFFSTHNTLLWALPIGLDGANLLYLVSSLLSSANSGAVWLILLWKDPFSHSIGPECEYGIGSGKGTCCGLAWATYIIQNDWLIVMDVVAPINLFHKHVLVKSDQRD